MQRHDLDLVSLIPGLLFVLIGLTFLTGRVDVTLLDLRWMWPIGAIALGIALLASLSSRREPD